jgi:outer membrane immunogenic protein
MASKRKVSGIDALHIAKIAPLIFAISLIVADSRAHATDLIMAIKAPAAASQPAWTGFYAGVQGGYGWARSSTADVNDFNLDPTGGIVGGFAGYSFQFPNRVVAGVEVDANYTNLSAGSSIAHANSTAVTTNTGDVRVNAVGTVRARIGYAFDRFLPYATGGFAWARSRLDYSQTQLRVGRFFNDMTESHDTKLRAGWTVGAGLEYGFAQRWSARIEYLYLDFGTATYPAIALPSAGGIALDLNGKMTAQTAIAGVAYRF